MPHKGRVLIIAGSDSGGGAGIQGDLKTVTTLGGYASTAITALTAQNTQGVFGIHDVPTDFIRQQITLVMDDIGADAFKTGMLSTRAIIETVSDTLAPYISSPHRGEVGRGPPQGKTPTSYRGRPHPNPPPKGEGIPLVLDPVMFAKGGAALLEPSAVRTLKDKLIPLARIVTPNIPEAENLADTSIASVDDMKRAAEHILRLGCTSVLVKGGHMKGDTLTDLLLSDKGFESFTQPRLHTVHTHGTGCTLASAIATGLAQGMALSDAVRRAQAYVRKAMEEAPGFGKGHGPLGHHKTITAFGEP